MRLLGSCFAVDTRLLPKYGVYQDFINLLLDLEELGNLKYVNRYDFWVKYKELY